MEYAPDDGIALDTTLYYTKLFTAVEPTSIVHKTGKWIFCTTRKKATKALEYIEKEMNNVYAQVPDIFRGDYAMCPNPRRLSRSPIRTAYMINIVTGANQNLTQNPNRNFQHAPRSNAWRSGPPSNLRTETETNSTGSKASLDSTHVITQLDEHREEVNVSVQQMQSSIQMFQTKTDAQFKSLTSQLETQIRNIQLNASKTQEVIQNSPAMSQENFMQLKNDIISELTPVIQSAIDSAMPSLIRQHMDASIGPAILHALSQLNLAPLPPGSSLTHHAATGLSPPRKLSRTHDLALMDVQDPLQATPPREPPDGTNSQVPTPS
jgi:hypothetical protein